MDGGGSEGDGTGGSVVVPPLGGFFGDVLEEAELGLVGGVEEIGAAGVGEEGFAGVFWRSHASFSAT